MLNVFSRRTPTSRSASPGRTRRVQRPAVEQLEDRCLLSSSAAGAALVAPTYGQMPLAFEANQGQAPAGVDFQTHATGYDLSLSAGEAVLALGRGSATSELHLQLVGANTATAVAALDPLVTRSNYLMGNDPSQWHTNIPNFGRVEYDNIYPGVDVAYYSNQGRLEYDFVVAPGADAHVIRMAIQGSQGLELDAGGSLVLHTPAGDVLEQAPAIYQMVDGVREEIAGRYVLLPSDGSATPKAAFAIGAYDQTRPLVIDPVLSYAFTTADRTLAIAVDGSGNAYVTGDGSGTGHGVMLGKLNPAGTAFVYLTYLGDNTSQGWGDVIAVDGSGNAYISGMPAGNFPTTSNALSSTASHMFMTKVDPTGSTLLYSTYVPGGDADYYSTLGLPGGIAVDGTGNIYLTGAAFAGLPTTPGAYQTTFAGNAGNTNAFVAEFNPALSGAASLVYASYLGAGQGLGDEGTGIALDGSGNVYITGVTGSTNFPTTAGAFQRVYGGGSTDSFVAKFNPALSGTASLVYSTLLGGKYADGIVLNTLGGIDPFTPGPGIAVDSSGAVYVAGATASPDFPTTKGAFQRIYGGPINGNSGGDAYVTKLNASGSALVYSTFLGGKAADGATGIALDSSGNVTVTGWTRSTNFPTKNPIQARNAGGVDMFVTTLNASGSGLLFSTYLGGAGDDIGCGIALDPAGNIYLDGYISSSGGFIDKINGHV